MIVYLHGFNSSPQSHKAQALQRYMREHGLESAFACPALPPSAGEAVKAVTPLLARKPCFVGSSLGGFYATYLAETHDLKAVLINPAVEPHIGLRAYVTEAHLREWERLAVPRITPRRYLLLVETGDEVLDYRQALHRYAGCEQVVIEGGDHSLQSFPRHLARILEFAGHAASL